jgi:hypothetical protein
MLAEMPVTPLMCMIFDPASTQPGEYRAMKSVPRGAASLNASQIGAVCGLCNALEDVQGPPVTTMTPTICIITHHP